MTQLALRFFCLFAAISSFAQTTPALNTDSLIVRIVEVDRAQRDQLKDLVLKAEYTKGEENDQGQFVEKGRYTKRIVIKYVGDSALLHEDYLQCWKEGKLQSDKDCQKTADEDREKKRRRSTPTIAYPMVKPFYPSHRPLYTIEYRGIAGERVNNLLCHHFIVTATVPNDTLINAEYFFDTESLHLVRVTFAPSKLVDRMMFKMSEMKMAVNYLPDQSGFWLPTEFNFRMKAKAMWVINVPTVATELYSEPIVNGGVSDALFEVSHGK